MTVLLSRKCARFNQSKLIETCYFSTKKSSIENLLNLLSAFLITGKISVLFFRSFQFSDEFSRIAIFRYNHEVDKSTQILFNSHINDETGLLQAYDRIPYDGSGNIGNFNIKQRLPNDYVSDFFL